MTTQPVAVPVSNVQSRFLTRVFGWMSVALLVTAAVAAFVAGTPAVAAAVLSNPFAFFGLLILEIGMVWYLTANLHRMSVASAQGAFLGYSVVNGLTLSVIFLVYTAASITSTFVVAAGMFGATAAYGYLTQRDLTRWGSLLMMGLFGLIIAGVVNLFVASSALHWLTSVIGVILFVGLTAFDMQKLRHLRATLAEGDEENEGRLAVYGALALYLDFVNMFLYLLRLLGRRK